MESAETESATKDLLDVIEFVEEQHRALLCKLSVFASTKLDVTEFAGAGLIAKMTTRQPETQGDLDGLVDETFTDDWMKDSIGSPKRVEHPMDDRVSPPADSASPKSSSKTLATLLMRDSGESLQEVPGLCPWLRPYLDSITVFLVVSSTIVLLLEAQAHGLALGSALWNEQEPTSDYEFQMVFLALDAIWDIFFVVEWIVLILAAPDIWFLLTFEAVCCGILVLISLVEFAMILCIWSGAFIQPDVFHIIHAVTSLRSLRCLRVLSHFKGPQLLLKACRSFLHSLFWAMIFLIMFMVSGALAISNVLHIFYDDAESFSERIWVWERYGTATRSLFTLFEITFSGSWPSATQPLMQKVPVGALNTFLHIFFVVYIATIAFGLIRVITAVFLRDTLDAAAMDAEEQVAQKLKKKAEDAKKLEGVFAAIDVDGLGLLTEQQLVKALGVPKIRAYFETLELDVWESKALFHILDDGDGTVTLKEFIDGLLKCKGPARAIDQVATHTEIKHLDKKLNRILSGWDPAATFESDLPRSGKFPLAAFSEANLRDV